MLALTGGAVGLLVAFWGLAAITKLLPTDFPRLNEIHIDLRILGFTFVASVLTGILLVSCRLCKSRVPTFRKRSRKRDEECREVVVKVVFARRSSWLRWRCRLCCWLARAAVQKFHAPAISRNRIQFATGVDGAADACGTKLPHEC